MPTMLPPIPQGVLCPPCYPLMYQGVYASHVPGCVCLPCTRGGYPLMYRGWVSPHVPGVYSPPMYPECIALPCTRGDTSHVPWVTPLMYPGVTPLMYPGLFTILWENVGLFSPWVWENVGYSRRVLCSKLSHF